MRYIKILLLALIVSGCASTTQGVDSDHHLNAGGGNGLIVIATRMSDHCGKVLNSYSLDFRQYRGGDYIGSFQLHNIFLKSDFENPDGYFYVRELPAGEYMIIGISDNAAVRFGGFIKPTLKFSVVPGKAQYLGEVTLNISACKGDDLPDPEITIKNEFERDAKLFDARMENLSSEDLTVTIMQQ